MSERRFTPLIETNDHEGETWWFWLQVDGNESELEKLKRNLSNLIENEYCEPIEYKFTMEDSVPESSVDILCRHANRGYMSDQQKVTGTFTFADLGNYAEFLYKGGIRDFFKDDDQ